MAVDNIDLLNIEALEKDMYLSGDERHNIIREFLDELRLCEGMPWFSDVANNTEKTMSERLEKGRENV